MKELFAAVLAVVFAAVAPAAPPDMPPVQAKTACGCKVCDCGPDCGVLCGAALPDMPPVAVPAPPPAPPCADGSCKLNAGGVIVRSAPRAADFDPFPDTINADPRTSPATGGGGCTTGVEGRRFAPFRNLWGAIRANVQARRVARGAGGGCCR